MAFLVFCLVLVVVGGVIGYWVCRMQLRGKFLLVEEMTPLPPSWCLPQEAPIYQEAHPPTQALPAVSVDPRADRDSLIRTRLCPDGYSAKQILSTHVDSRGFPKPAQYPGGLNAWYRDHGLPYRHEEEDN